MDSDSDFEYGDQVTATTVIDSFVLGHVTASSMPAYYIYSSA